MKQNHRRMRIIRDTEKRITFYTPETCFTHVHYFSSSTVNNEDWFVKNDRDVLYIMCHNTT